MSGAIPQQQEGGASNNDQDFAFKVDYIFYNEPYTCIMRTPKQSSLFLSVEKQSTCDQWCGEFTIQDVENVTATARNFKNFRKFVQMLFDGLKRTSTSVTLELLTRSQLELVCQKNFRRKSGSTATTIASSSTADLLTKHSVSSSLKENLNQRYLDMVYHVEYDCVHYPLPLSYVKPDAERLKKMVQVLREENAKVKEENLILRGKLKSQRDNSFQNDEETEKIQKENEKLRREYKNIKQAFEQLQKDSAKELSDVRKECENLTADYIAQKNEISNLKVHVETGHNNKQYLVEIRQLRRQLKVLSEDKALKDQFLKKKDDEIALYREDLIKMTKSEKRWRAECDRLVLKLDKMTHDEKKVSSVSRANGSSRGRSLSPSPRNNRPTSAPKSSTRFNPTQYVAQKNAKAKSLKPPVPKQSSRSSSRSSSVERDSSRGRLPEKRLITTSRNSDLDTNGRGKKNSRPSTPPRAWSRSPKLREEPKLDPNVLKNKLHKLNEKKHTRRSSSPSNMASKSTRKKANIYSDSLYSTSDYMTSDDERASRSKPNSRSSRTTKGSSNQSSRFRRKSSTRSDLYDTSDTDY